MAVAITATDTWIQHLPFVGGPRRTEFGDVDGLWYGVVSGLGDGSGGNITLNARLSEARKEDWVYVFQDMNTTVNTLTGQDCFTQINTGPLTPTETAVTNPSFSKVGIAFPVTGNAFTGSELATGGADSRRGMPIFGDKRIPGVFLMLAAGWETNIDGASYQLSSWGFLIRYNSFFRDVRPSVG